MKIYTRTGDDGTTGLLGGSRVHKSDPRLECYGAIDELNAAIGLAAVSIATPLLDSLREVQRELFVIGSHLATPDTGPRQKQLPALDPTAIERLERQIDSAEAAVPPLRQFILPGGSEGSARLHLARTICRRAERQIVSFAASTPVETSIVIYLNRLSDWLFVQARWINQQSGVPDIPWVPSRGKG